MAEARQGVNPAPAFGLHEKQVDPSCQSIQICHVDSGTHIFIPKFRILVRKFLRSCWCLRNKMNEACYPLPTWSIFLANSIAVFYAVGNARSGGISHWGPIQWLWKAPLAKHLPEKYRRAVFAVNATSIVLFLFTNLQRQVARQLLSYTGWMSELRGKRSLKTSVWGFLVKYVYFRSRSPLMLTYQNCLPKLPLPTLTDTTTKYLETINPLVEGDEFKQQQESVRDFLSKEGPKLQRYLKLKHLFSSNYISQWWLDIVYLRYRQSLTLNSNYYGISRAFGTPTASQISRAAVLIHNFVRAKLDIDHERLPPQLLQGTIPICMDQYLHAFSVTRVPYGEQDRLVAFGPVNSRHVLVLHKGRMYTMTCFSKRSGRPLTAQQLETTLLGIVQDKSVADEIEAALPVLTSLPRSQWAEIREKYFKQISTNNSALERIESALFVVSLDDTNPKNWSEEGLGYYIGDSGKNRWADKSLHLIITANARGGLMAEHSWGDASTLAHILELFLAAELREQPYDEKGNVKPVARDIQKQGKSQYAAERVRFNITPEFARVVKDALPVVHKELATLDLHIGCYDRYGKGLVKKYRCGPDAWIQMALQVAYYRDQGHFDQTYESGTTRLFRNGRTETIRSVSKESCAFVRALDDPLKSADEKKKLLQVACAAHQNYTQLAMTGRGVDRHLLALYIVSVGTGTPSKFLKEALGRPWKLSTSQIPQRQTPSGTWSNDDTGDRYAGASGGFGPVAEDGYGVSYTIAGEYRFFFHISSKHTAENTNSRRMYERLTKALDDMQAVFTDIPLMPLPEDLRFPYEGVWTK